MSQRTTIQVRDNTRKRLKNLKPYPSVSYDDLLQDMAEQYESEDSVGVK
ncbi:hypothetical protein SAMN05421809_3037 [Natronorubrum daqingense]|uniref:CopG family transcriptional regulator n=1 Tax=Natronorubrum daqingense TaxID=588898 RepID=A0A1N7F5W0_9EURY|nr:hypothetical protein SAMN05421809_3037 [Natronorubrum daqingense]